MYNEFRYKSKWDMVFIITLFVGAIFTYFLPITFIVVVLSFIIFIVFSDLKGTFRANDFRVYFITPCRLEVIQYKDIKKLSVDSKQVIRYRAPTYYNITIEIVTSEKTYHYTAKFEPLIISKKDVSDEFSAQYKDSPLMLLYNYINERIPEKEKPTE